MLAHDEAWAEASGQKDLELFAVGDIDEDELDRRNTNREQTIAVRDAAAKRANGVVLALERRAVALIPEVETKRVEALDRSIAARQPDRANMLAHLAKLDQADATDRQRKTLVKAELHRIRERFDAGYREVSMTRRRQSDEAARSIYKNYPSRRREAAAQGDEIALAMERENREWKARQERLAQESWEQVGGDGPAPRVGIG